MAINNKFLADVYSVAKSTGAATEKCVELLKSGQIKWHDAEGKLTAECKAVALEFRLGRIASNLKLRTREEAQIISDLSKPSKDGELDDTRRTLRQQQAYHAAVSAWNHIANLAGMPSRSGGKRPPKVRPGSSVTAPVAQAPKLPEMSPVQAVFAMPRAKSPDDAAAFAKRLADMLQAWQKHNGKAAGAHWAGIFADFEAKVRSELKPAGELPKAA